MRDGVKLTQQEFVRAMTNPITEAEWRVALSNKESAVFKELMSIQIELVMDYLVLEKILERLDATYAFEDRLEREAIIKDQINATLKVHELMRASAEQQAALQLEKAIQANLPPAELQKRVDELMYSIQQIEIQRGIVTSRLAETKESIRKLDVDWKHDRANEAKEFAKFLTALPDEDKTFYQTITYKDAKGNDLEKIVECSQLTPDKIQRIEDQCKAASLEDLFKVNEQLILTVADAVVDGASQVVNRVAGMMDFRNALTAVRECLMDPDDFIYKPSSEQKREEVLWDPFANKGPGRVLPDAKAPAAEAVEPMSPSRMMLQRLRENKQKMKKISANIASVDKNQIKKACELKQNEKRDESALNVLHAQLQLERELLKGAKEALHPQAKKGAPEAVAETGTSAGMTATRLEPRASSKDKDEEVELRRPAKPPTSGK